MKLVYVFDSRIILARSGSLIHVVEFLKALTNEGLDLTILTSYEAKEVGLKKLEHTTDYHQGVKRERPLKKYSTLLPSIIRQQVVKLNKTENRLKTLSRDRGTYKFYLDKLAHIKPDVIYQRHNLFTTSGLKAAKQLKIPVILEVNVPIFYEENLHLQFFFKRNEINTFSLADTVIVVSNKVKDILMKVGVSEDKICVIPNAVDAATFNPQVNGEHLRTNYGLNDDNIVVGFVGSFKPWHGVDIFLGLSDDLKERVKNVHLLLIGDNNNLNEGWKRYVSERADWITLTGIISHHDVPNHISIMDIAVMPNSNKYGSPIKIFEYMAMGKAAIAPKLGPIEEIIEDGVNGILIKPGDKNEFIEKIILLAENSKLRNRLGQQARNIVLKKHTWEKNASRVIGIIKGLF